MHTPLALVCVDDSDTGARCGDRFMCGDDSSAELDLKSRYIEQCVVFTLLRMCSDCHSLKLTIVANALKSTPTHLSKLSSDFPSERNPGWVRLIYPFFYQFRLYHINANILTVYSPSGSPIVSHDQ